MSNYERPSRIEPGPYKREDGTIKYGAYDPSFPHNNNGKTYKIEGAGNYEFEDPFDLDNLRILDKREIERLLKRLEGSAANSGTEIITAMIGTGGTIAMTYSEDGSLRPGLDVNYLLKYTSGWIRDKFKIESTNFPTLIDSSQQEIDYVGDMCIAISWIWKNMSDDCKNRFGGFIIAHGTDTMAESSNYLNMMLGPNCPFSICFVGAQRTIEDSYSDVGTNIQNAFQCIQHLTQVKEKGNFTCIGGTSGGAYHIPGLIKISDTDVVAFDNPTHGKMINSGNFGMQGIINPFKEIYDKYSKKYKIDNKYFYPIIMRGYSHVLRINSQMGLNPKSIGNIIRAAEDELFILLTTFGSFTTNTKLLKSINEIAQGEGKIVIAANPFPTGSIDHNYEEALALKNSGVLVTNTPPITITSKLTLSRLIFGENEENRRQMIDFISKNNYVGEIPKFATESDITSKTTDSLIELFGIPELFKKRIELR